MTRSDFEDIVRAVLDELPEAFAQRLENVEVVVEDEPGPELLRSLGMNPRRDTLLGLYQCVPLTQRGGTFGNALPDRISIYYCPILRCARTPAQIRHQVRTTLIHEIAHLFGLTEDAIRTLGY